MNSRNPQQVGRFPPETITRVPTAATISVQNPTPTSHSNACKAAEMKRVEGNLSELGCEWCEESKVFKVSPLWCLCRQGNILVVRWILQNNQKQVKLDGPQDQLHGRTLLHAAHVSGEFEIVALLLLAGAVPSKDNSSLLPSEYNCLGNNFQKKEMLKLWRNYGKGGTERIALDFPHLASTITIKNPVAGDKAIAEINNFIRTHQKLPNLQGKVIKGIGKIGDTLIGALEQLLLHYHFRIVDGEDQPTSLKEVYDRYLQQQVEEDVTASTRERSKPSIIQAATDIWNVNITIILYSTSQMKVSLKRYYVNKFYKKNYPTIYMTYDGTRFDYLIDETTHNTTHETLFTLIETTTSTQEDFVTALNYFDPSKINEFHEHRVVDREFKMKMTLLYYACRLGRSDIVQQLLAIDGINPNLGESRDKNTPLHVASWRGFYNIVVMLLYVKADATLKNSANEFPNAVSKDVPEKAKNELQRIWTIYAKGPETFTQEYQNFVIVDKELSTLTNSVTASTIASTNINLLLADKISVEQLCSYVDTENPPPLAEFKQILGKFNYDHINTPSVNHKCTVLYAAVRRGHFEIVDELLKIPKIKLAGSQETYSDSGNTCLHVANWRGHYRIVALLILRGAVLEPKKTGNRPNALSEKNFTLDEITRNTLALIYRNSEPINKDLLREIVDTPPPKTNSATGHLPLWAVIGLPKDDLPPQYLKSEYVWYRKTGNETKMTLLPLIQSSHLTATYLRERKSIKPIEVGMIIPPATGLFSSSCNWATETWLIDFQAMTAILKNNTNIKLAAITRSKIWFYSTLSQQESPYVPFPSSICNKISAAYSGGMGSLQFPFQMEKGFFAKPATCTIHFAKKEVTINNGSSRMTHSLLNEDEHNRITFWEPDAFLPRERVVYPPKEVTPIDIPITSEEGRRICSYFFLTVPLQQNNIPLNEIVKIQRLFYPELREKFEQNLSHAQALHSGNPLFANSIQYTRLLWHGTGHTDPMVIAKGGWKINYSSDRNLWGKGSYFASDAAYSASYAFQDKFTGNRKMFLAQVITGLGLQCLENGNIKDVPDGYNSIVGFRHGSWIYVTYDNGLAFPTYLIEWKSKN